MEFSGDDGESLGLAGRENQQQAGARGGDSERPDDRVVFVESPAASGAWCWRQSTLFGLISSNEGDVGRAMKRAG